jgi:hypothetical protein
MWTVCETLCRCVGQWIILSSPNPSYSMYRRPAQMTWVNVVVESQWHCMWSYCENWNKLDKITKSQKFNETRFLQKGTLDCGEVNDSHVHVYFVADLFRIWWGKLLENHRNSGFETFLNIKSFYVYAIFENSECVKFVWSRVLPALEPIYAIPCAGSRVFSTRYPVWHFFGPSFTSWQL